jgi:threonine 3-dehydrogenase
MRSIKKLTPGPGLTVTDADDVTCRPHDVVIRVHHAGMCGTDLHIADWDEWAQGRVKPPVIVGHEFAGEIVERGGDIGRDLAVGELVTAEGHIVCGHCRQCQTGNGHVCRNTQIIGVDRDGAFADYVAMPASNVMPLRGIPTRIGAIMDPLGNAFHTVLTAPIPASIVLVIGCGPIGCFAAGVARAAGAARVIAVDVNLRRLDLARKMGADLTFNPADGSLPEWIMDHTAGEGVDVVCEMSGNPAAIRDALRCAKPGGRVQLLGLPNDDVTLSLSNDVIFKGLSIYGVIGRRMYDTWHQMERFLGSGLFDPTPVITHTFPLEKVDDALAAIRSGHAGKVILSIKDDS